MKQLRMATLTGVIVLSIFFALEAGAFSFSPIVIDFAPLGAEATQTLTAENKGAEQIAVQVAAFSRVINELGKETLEPSEHFKIFPEQFILQPGQTRAVRITYRGPESLKSEAAYRFVAEQLPIELPAEAKNKKIDSGGRLNFLIRYETSVYVHPSGGHPQIIVEQIAIRPPEKQLKEIELTLKNDGTVHQLLSDIKVMITSHDPSSGTVTLSKEQLKVFEKQNLLAGARRKFIIPWNAKPLQPPLGASVSFAP